MAIFVRVVHNTWKPAVGLYLCLLGFLVPMLLSGVAYAINEANSPGRHAGNVILKLDPFGIISGNNQLSKRVDLLRRGITNPDGITAVFQIKSSPHVNNKILFNCFITLNNSGSQQFFCSLLDIPPPSIS